MPHDPPVMYIILNQDSVMSVQAVSDLIHKAKRSVTRRLDAEPTEVYRHWLSSNERQRILLGDQEQLSEFAAQYSDRSKDWWCRGKLIKTGYRCVVFCPVRTESLPANFPDMRLWP